MEYDKWMRDAINSIQSKVTNHQKFEVKALFDGCVWETLGKGERISFGRYFANEVRSGKVPNVVLLERGKNNHLRYIKICKEEQ